MWKNVKTNDIDNSNHRYKINCTYTNTKKHTQVSRVENGNQKKEKGVEHYTFDTHFFRRFYKLFVFTRNF